MTCRVLITRPDLPGNGPARLAEHVEVTAFTGTTVPTPAELRALAGGAHGIVCLGSDRVDGALLDAAGPSLQVVALTSVGFDRVDEAAAAQRGVVVTHTPGTLAETVADLAFALILMARRRLGSARDTLLAGEWDAFRLGDFLGLDVYGTTLGIVGYGEIGRAVARRARGFGMAVLRHRGRAVDPDDTSVEVDLPTLLAESDVVTLHTPLTDQTRHLIDAAALKLMKPTATLVNTARGPVVDFAALLAALRDGEIHSAGLDVFDHEPLGEDVAALRAEGRIVALPHIGSATVTTRAAMVDLAVDNVLDVLAGRPARTPLPGTAARPARSS
ncbi:2-hydroxyacid dehydrogenase [Pseudonocardia acidicola]|uniref:D-glycerate dehydrogenase n=1 Tax=Pseudonocardia acidicola TaxID=2724939 RepID=A0ABX1SCR7_9PSEU|nr:D-glycerate dehydrogenase [Pseudonocardia acidicola]NMH98322.1 D-glycerate dehydrogenase [Pseudonocardia acidicola]